MADASKESVVVGFDGSEAAERALRFEGHAASPAPICSAAAIAEPRAERHACRAADGRPYGRIASTRSLSGRAGGGPQGSPPVARLIASRMRPRNHSHAPTSPWWPSRRRATLSVAMPLPTHVLLPIPQSAAETAFGTIVVVASGAEARGVVSAAVDKLLPAAAGRLEISTEGLGERATAQHVTRCAEHCQADVVVMPAREAAIAARRLLAHGRALLSLPAAWRPGAGCTRIAVGYDGSRPAEAAS